MSDTEEKKNTGIFVHRSLSCFSHGVPASLDVDPRRDNKGSTFLPLPSAIGYGILKSHDHITDAMNTNFSVASHFTTQARVAPNNTFARVHDFGPAQNSK